MQAEERKYSLDEVRPYINWLYFDHAWQMRPTSMTDETGHKTEYERLHADANRLLDELTPRYSTRALFLLPEANADGDDLVLHLQGDCKRIPLLRQQHASPGKPCLCLADFVRPLDSGKHDRIGLFAATVDEGMEHHCNGDLYRSMLSQTLADRLAEATAELLHMQVRRTLWGYAPNEQLTIEQLHREAFQGIRPAVGYPSLPDMSINFLLDQLLGFARIGIRLTESGMMRPHASVSGLMLAHPQARYFDVGKVGNDQLLDYARRRHLPVEKLRRFVNAHPSDPATRRPHPTTPPSDPATPPLTPPKGGEL